MTLTRSLVALVALTALALTGCTNDPEQPGNGSGGSPTGEEPGQLSEADSPLRQYRDLIFGAGTSPNASPQERWRAYAEQQNQLNELIATCMSEQGFDYPVERINEEVVPTDLDGPAWEPESRDWVERYGYGLADYPLTVGDPQPLDYLLAIIPGLALLAMAVVGVVLIQRIMKAVAAGDPFAPNQVGRLRWLAALLLVGSIVHTFLTLSCQGAIIGRQDLGGLSPAVSFSLPFFPMLFGMVIAMLAEAFKVGGRLRDDVEGLI